MTSKVRLCLEAEGGPRCRRGVTGSGTTEVTRERHVAGVLATVSDEVRRLAERPIAQTTHVRLFTCTQNAHL